MERLFSDLKTVQRFRSGPLGVYIQKLADQLADSGFRRRTIRLQLRAADHFGRWLHRQKDVQAASLADIDAYMRRHGSVKHGDRKTLIRLFAILEEESAVFRSSNVTNNPRDSFLQRFADFLDRERGLCVGSIALQRRISNRLVDHCFGVGSMDWPRIEASQILSFIRKEVNRSKTADSARNITTAVRSVLNYLHLSGLMTKNLAGVVPAVASWSLATVPKGLSRDYVDRILKSCKRDTPAGRRDYAILLLLARLGLRAGEVARLDLEDIDWKSGLITVVGKGGQSSQLPLPKDVGKAITMYLRYSRPRTSCRKLFIRIPAPLIGLKGAGGIGPIVKRAIERTEVPSHGKGAHQFRHGLATEMLRSGASLSEIGEVLRHQDLRSTSIYAKVDINALRTLAQPWPGGEQ
jgi:site-specific recombinase XerC